MDQVSPQPGARRIPQVDRVLRHELVASLLNEYRREIVTAIVRQILADYRSQQCGAMEANADTEIDLGQIAQQVKEKLDQFSRGNLRKIVNGTGVILSTNLGRAPLPEVVSQKAAEVLQGYSNLEVELENGKRGERIDTISRLLALLTGCESAIVVNNNAAAVMLSVTALALKKEVIISRGELIEIGGSFRLPDVIESAGGILREVGTTNRTRSRDYEQAINENTGIILKCHRSNFEISGFTETAHTAELVDIGKKHAIAVIEDLGSGALIDYTSIGMKYEPTVPEVIEAGVDLVMFSGDKLMGGSQAGIICGKANLIKRLRDHPIYRALRADKLTIGILEQVLCQYLKISPEKHIAVMQMATETAFQLQRRVDSFIKRAEIQGVTWLSEISTRSAFGGGTLPGQTLESFGIALDLKTKNEKNWAPDKLLALLRKAPTPVIGIIQDNRAVIDFRTVQEHDEPFLLSSLQSLQNAHK